ncbi:MAG: hypothetical protein PVF17_08410 [Ignavibacteria bacterium]|jgi:hypothetical protein
MASLNMQGPYSLDEKTIDKVVTDTSSGNYALGKTNSTNGKFIVKYVGRADGDINARLKQWSKKSKYAQFKANYAASIKEAFEKECQNFHDFGGSAKLDNEIHPDRPKGKDYECPFCDIFDES